MKRILLSLVLLTGLLLGAASLLPQHGFAASPFEAICSSNNTTSTSGNSTVCKDQDKVNNPAIGPSGIITRITTLIAMATGVAAVIVIIISGIRIIISSGDSNTITSSRTAILYAVVGLVVAIAAQSIVVFVLNKL